MKIGKSKVGDSMENMIEAKGLVHEYSRRDENGEITEIKRALDGVDIQVKAGDFIAVLGANGSGKSTLIKGLLGLKAASAGRISMAYDNRDSDPRGIATLLSDLVRDLTELVRSEGRLVRSEINESGRKLAAGAEMLDGSQLGSRGKDLRLEANDPRAQRRTNAERRREYQKNVLHAA